MDTTEYEQMIGTERTERRKIGRDRYIELRYRVHGVQHHIGRGGESVTVWGRCIEHPKGEPGPTYPNSSWYDAYCSEIHYGARAVLDA